MTTNCYHCNQITRCSQMNISRIIDGRKEYDVVRVCGVCWDEVFDREGSGREHAGGGQAGGGTRIIRSSKPMT